MKDSLPGGTTYLFKFGKSQRVAVLGAELHEPHVGRVCELRGDAETGEKPEGGRMVGAVIHSGPQWVPGLRGAVVDLITVIRAVGPMVDLVVMTRWPLVGAISTALGLVSGGS